MGHRALLSFIGSCICLLFVSCGESDDGNGKRDTNDDKDAGNVGNGVPPCDTYCAKVRTCGAEEYPNQCVRLCEVLIGGDCGAAWKALYECGDRLDFECKPDDNEIPAEDDCPAEYQVISTCTTDGGA